MRNVYVTLEGVLGDYIKPVRTQSRTGSYNLKNLQAALNATVNMYSTKPASSENCKALWETLLGTAQRVTNSLTDEEMTWDKFKEIESWLGSIGEQLAFGARRKGVSRSSHQIYRRFFLTCDTTSPEFLEYFLKHMVCVTSLDFRKEQNAVTLWAHYDEMSDAELIEEAINDRYLLMNSDSLTPKEMELINKFKLKENGRD